MYAASMLVAGALMLGTGQAEAGVAGTGMEKVEVMPTVMRMAMTVQAVGDNLDAALDELQKRTDDLSTKLKELQPVEGTLKVEGLKKVGGATSEQERMMAMMRGRFGQPEKKDEEEEGKVTVQSTMMADWALSAKDAIGLLKECDKLQEAISAAAPKEEKKDEEAELDEDDEEAMLMAQYQSMEEGAPSPGTPTFAFVAKADEAQLAEARRKAYESARKNAEEAVAAAGLKLGSLVRLSASTSAASGDDYQDYAMRRYYQTVFAAGTFGGDSDAQNEAVSNQPKPLSFNVMVNAQFGFSE